MTNTPKKILLTLLGLTVVGIGTLAALPFVIDPNQFKEELSALVRQQTGRELTVKGEISLSVFPWAGVTLNQVALSNAPGFGTTPMAQVKEAMVRVKLLPLLSKRMEMDRVTLRGVDLAMGRNKSGKGNWEDLTPAATPSTAETQTKPATDKTTPVNTTPASATPVGAIFTINGLEIQDANLSWHDERKGQSYAIRHLALTTGPIAGQQPVDIALAMELESNQPAFKGKLGLNGRAALDQGKVRLSSSKLTLAGNGPTLFLPTLEATLTADLEGDLANQVYKLANTRLEVKGSNGKSTLDELRATLTVAHTEANLEKSQYRLGNSKLEVDGAGPVLPGSRLTGTLTADIDANLAEQSLTITHIDLRTLEQLHLTGSVNGNQILESPSFSGNLLLDKTDLRVLLAKFGITPTTADPKALTVLAFTSAFKASDKSFDLSKLDLQLDESHLTGILGVANFAKPAIRFVLVTNALDVDRYLAPESKEGSTTPSQGQTPTPPTTPTTAAGKKSSDFTALRNLDLQGTLKAGRFKVADAKMSDVLLKITAKDGMLKVDSLDAKLYEGSMHAVATLDVRGETPQFTLNKELKGVQSAPLLKDVAQLEVLSGAARLSGTLRGKGMNAEEIKKSLNGDLAFGLDNGVVHGVDLAAQIRNAYKAIKAKGQSYTPEHDTKQTDFSLLSGTLAIRDGVITNQDLKGLSKALSIAGKGEASLPGDSMDYLVNANILSALDDVGSRTVNDLKGLEIPVRFKGTLSKPSFTVDLAALLESLAKTEAKQKLEEKLGKKLDGKLGEKLEEKLGKDGKDKLEKELGSALKNFLKF